MIPAPMTFFTSRDDGTEGHDAGFKPLLLGHADWPESNDMPT